MRKALLYVLVCVLLLAAVGCAGSSVEGLGKVGTRLWVKEVNLRVDDAFKLSDEQEDAFGDAVYQWGEEAVQDVKQTIKEWQDEE